MAKDDTPSQHNWRYRRRYLIFVTIFTMAMMGVTLWFRPESSISKTVIEMGFVALISFVGSYVFGAVWDHMNKRKVDASVSFKASVGDDNSKVD